jgi:hypothetical protein
MKKSWLCVLILLSSTVFESNAQSWRKSPYEAILGFGSANFFGDIGGTAAENNLFGLKDIRLRSTRPSIHAGFRYFLPENFAVRGNISIAMLGDTDKGSKNESREFTFTTLIGETSALGEYFIARDISIGGPRVNRRGLLRNYATFSAYAFAGIGSVLYFVSPNEKLEQVQEIRGIEHGFITLVLPVGVGLKLGIANNFDIGLEIGGRYSFSDYLEGYTSQFSKANDIYYLTHINVIYRIPFR